MNTTCFHQVKTFTLLLIIVSVGLFTCITIGCKDAHRDSSESVVTEAEKLNTTYLESDIDQARKCLVSEIQLVENSKIILPPRQAAILFLTSCRLYVLEKKAGNESASNVAFVKARYWNLRRYELGGRATEEGLKEFFDLTQDKISEMIEKNDKYLTKGRGSRYTLK